MDNMQDAAVKSPSYYVFSDFSLTILTQSAECHSLISQLTHFSQSDKPLAQNITLQFEENADLDLFFAKMPSSAELQYEVKPAAPGERGIQVYGQGSHIRWLRFPGFGGVLVDHESRQIFSCFVSKIITGDLVPFIFFIVQPLSRMVSCFQYYFLHAAALSVCDQGIIVTGLSGRGKSTSTMAMIDGGHAALTDEYTFLRRENESFSVYTMMDWLKLSPDAHNRFFRHRKTSGLFCENDEVYHIRRINSYDLKQPLDIRFVFILEQSGRRDTNIQSASVIEVIPELLPISTSLYNPEQQKLQFELFADFLSTLLCYRVSFGTDMHQFVSAIEQTVQNNRRTSYECHNSVTE